MGQSMSGLGEPQWLTADERSAWLALTGLLVRLPGALDNQLERDSHLSFFEYMVLAMLAEQEDQTLRMSALAELTNGSLSRLSHVVRRLENQGLVVRETCQEDRRATDAILTATGREREIGRASCRERVGKAVGAGDAEQKPEACHRATRDT